MERLPEHVTIIYLANPSLSRDDILYAIADELGLAIPENARPTIVMRMLHDHLIQAYSQQRQVVVLIDEAHAMPAETLEEIRLLSNLESNHSKLLQLVLFGQPELNAILARADMRQLKERITHNFSLEPLIRDDIANYLDFRMRAAGYKGPSVFTPQAIKEITKVSLGLTRRINILADKALLAAFAEASHQIGPKQMHAAIQDCDFSDAPFAGESPNKLSKVSWGLLLAGVIAIAASLFYFNRPEQTPDLPKATAAAPALPTTPVQANSPTPQSQPAAPENTPIKPQAPLLPETANEALKQQDPLSSPTQTQHKFGPKTTAAIRAGQDWLARSTDQRWFIQLYAVGIDDYADIEYYLTQTVAKKIPANELRAYVSDLSGRERIGVIYGDFATSAEASAAIRSLPPPIKTTKPYPRQAIKLRSAR
jgi:type II secretory pathway predicted ATPase ExeA